MKTRTEEDISLNMDKNGNLEAVQVEEDMSGGDVTINFELPGRYSVETEVNFMTANMSLSMRRTVRTQSPTQQRPRIDPDTKPCTNYRIKASVPVIAILHWLLVLLQSQN